MWRGVCFPLGFPVMTLAPYSCSGLAGVEPNMAFCCCVYIQCFFLFRSEEQCLVRSGLVQLMDQLCSLSSQRDCSSSEKQTKKQKVATMAWAAFQVLANRCIEWEKVEGTLHCVQHQQSLVHMIMLMVVYPPALYSEWIRITDYLIHLHFEYCNSF